MTGDDMLKTEPADAANDGTPQAEVTGVDVEALNPQVEEKPARGPKWTKLSSLEIGNFKALEGIVIDLADVTVLVGPNSSGKSSVLQAAHWAARAASYISPRNTKEVISFDRLDYLPSSDPLRTAYRAELATDTGSRPTHVSFQYQTAAGEKAAATVKIWAARNKGGIAAHIDGGAAVTPFKQRTEFITAYIPGLAGLAEKESILAKPLLRRQAASGDAGGVLRNVLFNLASRQAGEMDDEPAKYRVRRLNELVSGIHPGVSLEVHFDEREDVNIRASFTDPRLNGVARPLEAAATGVLQVVQIFSYIILFRPKLLLVDEPDAHLHPDKQERLIEALETAAEEFEAQVILTTHSPHIARAASPKVNLVWIQEGKQRPESDDTIRRLLGWGALDKRCVFFVEDEEDAPVRALMRQWPGLSRQVAISRCFGIDNLPKNSLLEGLMTDSGLKIRALVHRDRDFMTDAECLQWAATYSAPGTFAWCTEHVDVEAYFCQPAYLACLYKVHEDVAKGWIEAAAQSVGKARDKFFEKRKAINYLLYKDGGSPSSESLWQSLGGQNANTVLGKKLLAALKPVIKRAGQNDKLLDKLTIPPGMELASDLRLAIERSIA